MGFVYKITNTVNGKSYIGISIHEPTQGRIKDHLSGKGNRIIANAVKKYGNQDAFTYEILEANVFDEFLPDLEIAYIAKYKTVVPHGYNLTSGGDHTKLSQETRNKMSLAHKGKTVSEQTRRKLSELNKGEKHPNFGKKRDAEAIRKTAEANRGQKRSAETKRRISEAKKNKPRPAEAIRKTAEANRGQKRSAETKRRISEALKGRKFSKEHCSNLSKSMSGEKHPQFGKPLSAEHRHKISESQKGEKNHNFGKSASVQKRKRMSEAHRGKRRHPDYNRVHAFFLQLSKDMPISEKRRCVLCEFPNPARVTLYRWIRQWESNRETAR